MHNIRSLREKSNTMIYSGSALRPTSTPQEHLLRFQSTKLIFLRVKTKPLQPISLRVKIKPLRTCKLSNLLRGCRSNRSNLLTGEDQAVVQELASSSQLKTTLQLLPRVLKPLTQNIMMIWVLQQWCFSQANIKLKVLSTTPQE